MNGLIEASEFVEWLLKYYLPPMIANASPVLVKGARRIDRGRLFIDGKPVFGSNKTWEGLLIGVVNSYIAGSSLALVFRDSYLAFLGLGAGLFALLGDMIGAFIKRRIGLKPGDPALFLDQWDFILGATFFYYVTNTIQVFEKPEYILILLVLTFILHVSTNLIAYVLGLKQSKL